MEGMDADCYVIEYAIRDRLNRARATARTAALLARSNGLARPQGIETRLAGLGRELVNGTRKMRAEISRALRDRARMAKPSSPSLSARRGS